MKVEECPECGNNQIILVKEEFVLKEYSAKTGKLLKSHGFIGTNCWNYKCRCGWNSELFTE
ncbi:hypothetical protein ABE26_07500 [Cytobacillus firmus]|nr:hypothetical protein [Cytobacillus firmus]